MGKNQLPPVEKNHREKGKYWHCQEPWSPQHQCKVKNRLHTILLEGEQENANLEAHDEPTEMNRDCIAEERQPQEPIVEGRARTCYDDINNC